MPISIRIGGETVALAFTWEQIRQARNVWGDGDAMEFVSNAGRTLDVERLAMLTSIAGTPVLSVESIMMASPAIEQVTAGLKVALYEAFKGNGLVHDDEQEPREPADPLPSPVTGSRRPTTRPSKRGSRTSSSGA